MAPFLSAPEVLLGRNDSKHPLTTCRGITSSGRACRRALAASKATVLNPRWSGDDGVVLADVQDGIDVMGYCWQHKDQAEQRVTQEVERLNKRSNWQESRASKVLHPLQERGSIETLVQRLGLETNTIPAQINGDKSRREGENGTRADRKRSRDHARPPKRTETRDFAQELTAHHRSSTKPRTKQKPESKGFWASLCCMGADSEDYVEIVRHRQRTAKPPEMSMARPMSATRKPLPSGSPNDTYRPLNVSLPSRPLSRLTATEQLSGTKQLLSLIPRALSPQVTSALLIELSKPISLHDEEGYIYIFWLTPQSKQAPAHETAKSLLNPDHPNLPQRRISDVMTEYSFTGSEPPTQGKKTIMLKIGRANNVTRRMNEWQRQCGYALNLVRWYPYVSSLQQIPVNSSKVQKIPCVKRVERLIHLELADRQVKQQCAACGREHREWFEVEASHAGVKSVDDCVKRWATWAEGVGRRKSQSEGLIAEA